MRKNLVAINTNCMGVTEVTAWVRRLITHNTYVLIFIPLHYFPAYELRYLKDLLAIQPPFLKLCDCKMLSPGEMNRLQIDTQIMTHSTLQQEAELSENVWLLSPNRDSWPVPADFSLDLLTDANAHISWNPVRLGLKIIDKQTIIGHQPTKEATDGSVRVDRVE